jgi:PPOX class probable F420-dependent enzyme
MTEAIALPAALRVMLDAKGFAVLCTLNPDGGPQSSIIWATYENDEMLFSTILGRRKPDNMSRDPRVSLCVFEQGDAYRFVEVRGTVSMTQEGGPELIQQLSLSYEGRPFTESKPTNVRVVCRVTPTHIVVH